MHSIVFGIRIMLSCICSCWPDCLLALEAMLLLPVLLLPLLPQLSQATSCGVEACLPRLLLYVIVVCRCIGAHLDCRCQDRCSATM